MRSRESVWRAALPTRTHEWAIVPEDEPDGWAYDRVVGQLPLLDAEWFPVPVEVVSPREGRAALRAAMPWWTSSRNVLVLRDEAVESVGLVLAEHGELLPLAGRNAHLVMFCAPLLADALVEGESELRRSVGSYAVRLDRGTFDRNAVRDLQAFVVPVGRGHALLLTEQLVREVEGTGDTAGVRFEEVGVLR